LYWIKGRGNFRQFVFNRVQKIQQHRDVKWHYVPTTENPADLESRGGNIVNHPLWSHGPSWPSEAAKWPSDIILEASPETEKEMKVTITSVLATAVRVQDDIDKLLDSHELRKVHRIGAWVQRFIQNCRQPRKNRKVGPLE
jgi:hypothetical protein